MNSMHPLKTPQPLGSALKPALRRVPRAFAILVAVMVSPLAAFAQGGDDLPKGYTSDGLPVLPPSQQQAQAPGQAVETQAVTDVVVTSDEYVDTDASALSDFREPLNPYGTWVEDSTYGTVWVPAASVVGADFAPYQSAGRWALTDDGDWLWVSDYEWGHVPFHYGRWVWIGGRGWSWIPGRVYAPAWVSWRVSEYGYIGWAPMAPTWYWSSGSAVSLWVSPPAAYVFCPTTHVFYRHVHTHVVRDTHIIRRIGAHSHTYKPAEASVGGSVGAKAPGGPGSGSAMAPHKGAQAARKYPKGPSLAEARVPQGVEPKMRVSHDQKALAFSTRSSTAKAKTMPAAARGLQGSTEARGGAERSEGMSTRAGAGLSTRGSEARPERAEVDSSARQGRGHGPVMRTPVAQPRYESAPAAQPRYESAPAAQPRYESAPAAQPSRRVTRSAPSQASQPSQPAQSTQPAPVKRQSSTTTQAPTRSAPPAAAAPRPSVQAAPSRPVQRSAPSHSSSPSRPSTNSRSSHRR